MSHQIEIIGWRPGFRKVSTTILLRETCSLSLKEAKALTDTVLQGQVVTLSLDTLPQAYDLAHQLQILGGIVRLNNPNSHLLDNALLSWVSQELSHLFHTPIAGEQRLRVSRHFIETLADKLSTIPLSEHQHVLNIIDFWYKQKAIDNTPLPRDKATIDWFEAIIGTIAGMIEEES